MRSNAAHQNAPPPTDLWGFADLHCHPMSQRGFGGSVNGDALTARFR